MLFSRRSATSACTIALVVMAVTPYHRFHLQSAWHQVQ